MHDESLNLGVAAIGSNARPRTNPIQKAQGGARDSRRVADWGIRFARRAWSEIISRPCVGRDELHESLTFPAVFERLGTRVTRPSGFLRQSRSGALYLRAKLFLLATLLLAANLGVSCRSLDPLPPVDLSAPGYRVQQGQALWKPTKTRPELAGELLLATRTNGDLFVQFMKTPFTLATAQRVGDQWQIDLGSGDYRRRGHGPPPVRFVWFQLPAALAGAGVSGNWSFERVTTNSWRLENHRTGEALEGGFFP